MKVSSVLASEAPAASAEQKSDPGLEAPRVVHLERDTVLYFGRKAKKALPRSPLQHGANRLTHVPIMLPKSAKNASRIHCSARIVSAPSSSPRVQVEIRVTGQNGMKVDGKVRRDGSVVRLEKRAGESVKLRFWGWDAQLVVAESEAEMRSEEGSDGELGDLPSEVEEEEVDTSTCSKRRSRPASRAASPALSFYSDDHGLSPQQRPTHLPTSSPLSPPPSLPSFTPSASSARAASLTRSLNLDLPGLVASSIVFHSRSTVAVDEIIHALLRETGSMWDVLSDQVEELKDTEEGERRAVEAWRGEVETVLDEEEMFGKIDNTGLKVRLPPFLSFNFITSNTLADALLAWPCAGRLRPPAPPLLLLHPRLGPLPRPRRRARTVRQARQGREDEEAGEVFLGQAEFEEESVSVRRGGVYVSFRILCCWARTLELLVRSSGADMARRAFASVDLPNLTSTSLRALCWLCDVSSRSLASFILRCSSLPAQERRCERPDKTRRNLFSSSPSSRLSLLRAQTHGPCQATKRSADCARRGTT